MKKQLLGKASAVKKQSPIVCPCYRFLLDGTEVKSVDFLKSLGETLYGSQGAFYEKFGIGYHVAKSSYFHPDDSDFSRDCIGFEEFLKYLGFDGNDADIAFLLLSPQKWIDKLKERTTVKVILDYTTKEEQNENMD